MTDERVLDKETAWDIKEFNKEIVRFERKVEDAFYQFTKAKKKFDAVVGTIERSVGVRKSGDPYYSIAAADEQVLRNLALLFSAEPWVKEYYDVSSSTVLNALFRHAEKNADVIKPFVKALYKERNK